MVLFASDVPCGQFVFRRAISAVRRHRQVVVLLEEYPRDFVCRAEVNVREANGTAQDFARICDRPQRREPGPRFAACQLREARVVRVRRERHAVHAVAEVERDPLVDVRDRVRDRIEPCLAPAVREDAHRAVRHGLRDVRHGVRVAIRVRDMRVDVRGLGKIVVEAHAVEERRAAVEP